MKSKPIKMKWKIFFYLALFVGLLLGLLWLFQIVFLEQFYEQIKLQESKKNSVEISRVIQQENPEEGLQEIARHSESCIQVLTAQGTELYAVHIDPFCTIHKLYGRELYSLYQEAKQSDEKQITQVMDQRREKDRIGGAKKKEVPKSILQVSVVERNEQEDLIILLNTTISPVNATVETLRVQLLYISVIVITLSLILALLISRKLAKPIITTSALAKELAYGNYEVDFYAKGYLEIAELNETLQYAAKELSKVEGLRRELIANISHDLRTPLTMITGYGEVMRDIPGENNEENIQIIIEEAKRLNTLVDDLLDLSKLQAGIQVLNRERFSITQLVRSILNRYTKLMEQQGYEILFAADADRWIDADEVKITQVIYNLINNAINYTGEDKRVVITQELVDGKVKISITDTGEGIEEAFMPYIWERYYKINKAHKRAQIGTGLGLSIVKNILVMHEAAYGVMSTKGNGSTFWFALPLANEMPKTHEREGVTKVDIKNKNKF